MLKSNYFLICSTLLLLQTCYVYSTCLENKSTNGTISDKYFVYGSLQYHKCWKVLNPARNVIHFHLRSLNLMAKPLLNGNLTLLMKEENKNYTYWSANATGYVTTSSNVIEIYFKVDSRYYSDNTNVNFTLYYEMVESDLGIRGIEGVREARFRAISWLKSKQTTTWGWQENTHRAVTALFLANAANFNGTNLEEELMAKEIAIKAAITLLKKPISNEILSMLINSLLVTCHSPNHFYGQNLVKRLKEQVETSTNFIHPVAYLTLCNAKESWPSEAIGDLIHVFNSTADYHFVKDIQAYAVMAVFCYTNDSKTFNNKEEKQYLLPEAMRIVTTFKEHQFSDGSFGNVATTSLVTQALISSGDEAAKYWDANATIKYLIKKLNSADIDFTTVYLTLPVFNAKSLSDILKVNCTGSPRERVKGDLISEINDYAGPKMSIQYSLFVGDGKDVVRTLYLKVPVNYTAYEVMLYAGEEDNKYKFEYEKIMGKLYVYRIGKMANDPETGKFWLLYLGSSNSTDVYKHTTASPDKLFLENENHLVMWYKTATI